MKRDLSGRAAATALVIAVFSAIVGTTFAKFSNTSATPSNSYAAGTVRLTDDASGGAVVSMASAKPGDSRTGCIRVRYEGSIPANVRLYAQMSGPLASALQLTITRGSDPSPSFSSCNGFVADQTDYTGAGPGVVYSGSLAAFPDTYGAGVVDPTASSPKTWTENEVHSYRYDVVFNGTISNQGQSSSATFTWEARKA